MQSPASLQLALHYMQLRNEKLSEILILVRLQHGKSWLEGILFVPLPESDADETDGPREENRGG